MKGHRRRRMEQLDVSGHDVRRFHIGPDYDARMRTRCVRTPTFREEPAHKANGPLGTISPATSQYLRTHRRIGIESMTRSDHHFYADLSKHVTNRVRRPNRQSSQFARRSAVEAVAD